MLPIAPSTYRAHAAKRADPAKLSARAKQDAIRKIKIRRVFAENFDVYGVRKVWRQLRREGEDIARCTVERLMRSMGLQGVIRGKPVKTTISDKAAPCPLDHVNRQFRAPRPNALWVSDFTYVATWPGFVYVAFVIDAYARRIVGWRASRTHARELSSGCVPPDRVDEETSGPKVLSDEIAFALPINTGQPEHSWRARRQVRLDWDALTVRAPVGLAVRHARGSAAGLNWTASWAAHQAWPQAAPLTAPSTSRSWRSTRSPRSINATIRASFAALPRMPSSRAQSPILLVTTNPSRESLDAYLSQLVAAVSYCGIGIRPLLSVV